MAIALADEAVSRAYGAGRSKAESTVTAMGCGLRCNALDVGDVREKLRLGGHRVDLPDISPGGESHFVLATILEYESWKEQVYLRSSRRRSDKPDHTRPSAPVDRKSHKEQRAALRQEEDRRRQQEKTGRQYQSDRSSRRGNRGMRIACNSATSQEVGQRGSLQDIHQRGAAGPLRENEGGTEFEGGWCGTGNRREGGAGRWTHRTHTTDSSSSTK